MTRLTGPSLSSQCVQPKDVVGLDMRVLHRPA